MAFREGDGFDPVYWDAPFFIALSATDFVFFLVVLAILYKRQGYQPLHSRSPPLLFLQSVGLLFFSQGFWIRFAVSTYPCALAIVHIHVAIFVAVAPMFLRVWRLVFLYKLDLGQRLFATSQINQDFGTLRSSQSRPQTEPSARSSVARARRKSSTGRRSTMGGKPMSHDATVQRRRTRGRSLSARPEEGGKPADASKEPKAISVPEIIITSQSPPRASSMDAARDDSDVDLPSKEDYESEWASPGLPSVLVETERMRRVSSVGGIADSAPFTSPLEAAIAENAATTATAAAKDSSSDGEHSRDPLVPHRDSLEAAAAQSGTSSGGSASPSSDDDSEMDASPFVLEESSQQEFERRRLQALARFISFNWMLTRIALPGTVLVLGLGIGNYFMNGSYHSEKFQQRLCAYGTDTSIFIGCYWLLYSMTIIVSWRMLRNVREGVGIKRELRLTAYLWIIVGGSYMLVQFLILTTGAFDTLWNGVAVMVGIWGQNCISVLWPAYQTLAKADAESDESTSAAGGVAGTAAARLTVDAIISSTQMLDCFRNFLALEFSSENLLFIEDVRRYRAVRSSRRRQAVAERMYRNYFSRDAATPVNVPSSVAAEVTRRYQEGSASVFNAARDEIVKLLEGDSIRRFVRTDEFEKARKAEELREQMLLESGQAGSGKRRASEAV